MVLVFRGVLLVVVLVLVVVFFEVFVVVCKFDFGWDVEVGYGVVVYFVVCLFNDFVFGGDGLVWIVDG